jgi:hypothetical protein
MVKSALHTRTKCSTDGRWPDSCESTVRPDHSAPPELPQGSIAANESFDIGSFDLVRKFMEHLLVKNASEALGNSRLSHRTIDWQTVEASVADSRSFEQAIGRAVVIADQMCRGVFGDAKLGDVPPNAIDPFFPFSVADVVPDFGDESRYRTRVARRVGRIFGGQRALVAVSRRRTAAAASGSLRARPLLDATS